MIFHYSMISFGIFKKTHFGNAILVDKDADGFPAIWKQGWERK